MGNVRVRQFRQEDAKLVVQIAKCLDFTQKSLKTIKADAKKTTCLVAEVNSKPAGFILFKAGRQSGKIDFLAVKNRFQGFGLGSRLLKKAESCIKARKAKKMTVHTFGFSGNYAPFFKVRDFYHRHGFQRLREIPNGFMNGVDKLVMFKEF